MTSALRQAADTFGTPAFVYSVDRIRDQVHALHDALGARFTLSYAAKANPHPAILGLLAGEVDGLDVSSAGELGLALHAGWPADRIGFTGPVKSPDALRRAVRDRIGAVVLESPEEAADLDRVAAEEGAPTVPVLVRITPSRLPPGFGVRMAGRPTRFGVDEEDLAAVLPAIAAHARLDLVGFHAYSGTQCLDAEGVAENWLGFVRVFRTAAGMLDLAPRRLVFGAGLGIPYHEGDEAVNLAAVAARALPGVESLLAEDRFAGAALVLETGRFLVGEAGTYLTRVVRIKRSRGVEIAILDGGMHHHLAAAGHLGSVIPRNFPIARVPPAEPGEETREYDLAGPLCTSVDVLGHGVRLPELRAGDLLAIGSSGAYGPTASPLFFIGRDAPREVLVETRDGAPVVTDVSAASVFASGPRSAP